MPGVPVSALAAEGARADAGFCCERLSDMRTRFCGGNQAGKGPARTHFCAKMTISLPGQGNWGGKRRGIRPRDCLEGASRCAKTRSERLGVPVSAKFQVFELPGRREEKKRRRTRFCVVILRQSTPCEMPSEMLAALRCRCAAEFHTLRTRFCVAGRCPASGEATTGGEISVPGRGRTRFCGALASTEASLRAMGRSNSTVRTHFCVGIRRHAGIDLAAESGAYPFLRALRGGLADGVPGESSGAVSAAIPLRCGTWARPRRIAGRKKTPPREAGSS